MSVARSRAGRWAVVTLFWTAEGLSSASAVHLMAQSESGSASWADALRVTLSSAWLWVPLTMLAFAAAERFPFGRGRLLVPLAAHVLGALAVSAFRAGAVIALNGWVGWYETLPSLTALYIRSLQNNVFMYWLLVGIGHALLYARTSRIRGEQLARAQLQALKAQLQPHFLFNALNTISSFVRDRPDMAERMIENLARLLRQSLDSQERDEVSLRHEMETLQPYLDIERARFEDRLRFTIEHDAGALDARVPHLLLQPLVENAVRHGLAPTSAPGVVEIRSRLAGGRLELEVADNGVGLPDGFALERAAGLGLSNTKRRLEQLYGGAQSLRVERLPGGTRVRVSLPFRPLEVTA